MVESSIKAGGEVFEITDLNNLPELSVPYLCEVWNWQGDTSVLPHKWVEVLNNVSGQEEAYSTKFVKQDFVSQTGKFDPNAFFFLTYRYIICLTKFRSHAIGLCLAWPTKEKEFEIKHLCTVPSQRNKGVEEALLTLVLQYCKTKGADKVTITFDEDKIYEYQKSVLKPVLIEKFGFVEN